MPPYNEQPRAVFENEEFQRSTRSFEPETSKVVQLVIKYSGGYIKDAKQANYALLGFVALAIVISLFMVFSAVRSPSPPPANQIIWIAGPEGGR